MGKRKSQIIEEEEEDVPEQAVIEEEDEDEDDGDIEEVEEFSDVEENLGRGERVSSVVIWDDPPDLSLTHPEDKEGVV